MIFVKLFRFSLQSFLSTQTWVLILWVFHIKYFFYFFLKTQLSLIQLAQTFFLNITKRKKMKKIYLHFKYSIRIRISKPTLFTKYVQATEFFTRYLFETPIKFFFIIIIIILRSISATYNKIYNKRYF